MKEAHRCRIRPAAGSFSVNSMDKPDLDACPGPAAPAESAPPARRAAVRPGLCQRRTRPALVSVSGPPAAAPSSMGHACRRRSRWRPAPGWHSVQIFQHVLHCGAVLLFQPVQQITRGSPARPVPPGRSQIPPAYPGSAPARSYTSLRWRFPSGCHQFLPGNRPGRLTPDRASSACLQQCHRAARCSSSPLRQKSAPSSRG